jgi:uncharacterized protein YjdB
MKKKLGLSALVSPRVLLGVGLVSVTALFGGTGCGLSYSLTGIYVQPTTACVYPGTTAQFTAYGTYTEGNHSMRVENVSSQVSWTSDLPDLATVSASGLAQSTGNYVGNTSITATTNGEFGVLDASGNLVVSTSCTTSSVRRALNIVPGNQSLEIGQTFAPLAIATLDNKGTTSDFTRQVTWQSSNPNVATVDAKGVITAVSAGDAVITAQGRTASGEFLSATQTIHTSAQDQ